MHQRYKTMSSKLLSKMHNAHAPRGVSNECMNEQIVQKYVQCVSKNAEKTVILRLGLRQAYYAITST